MGKRSTKNKFDVDVDSYILPSKYEELKDFISKFKIDMMQQIVSSIEFAIENKYSVVEVFQFKDSEFVITLNKAEFIPNLEHIDKYLKSKEIFELCPTIEKLLDTLKKEPHETEEPE